MDNGMEYYESFEPGTLGNLIGKFRSAIGDETCSVPEHQIRYFINKTLRRLGQINGLEDLFVVSDSMQLDIVDDKGNPTARWGLPDDLINLYELQFINLDNVEPLKCIKRETDSNKFYSCAPFPEFQKCGTPECYLVERCEGRRQIVFARPPSMNVGLRMKYQKCPPELKELEDKIEFPKLFCDLVVDGAIIWHKKETTDYAQHRAEWETFDLHALESSEVLNKADKAFGYRQMNSGFDGGW